MIYIFSDIEIIVLSISIKPKDDSKDIANQSFIIKYNESEAKDVISHILTQYGDYSFEAQYRLFLSISGIGLSKSEFGLMCKDARRNLNAKFVEQNALMEYHVDTVMVREHTKMVKALVKEWNWYMEQWEKAAYKENPDISRITKLSRLIHVTMKLLSEFNLGTNVILFIQKKMELLETKSKALNIKDLNDLNKYDDTNNIDNKVNDLSLPTEAAVAALTETGEDGLQNTDGRVIPKIKRNQPDDVQGGVSQSTEEGSGGTQTAVTERARGSVF